jgi:type VI secretion system protein ImpM
MFNERCGISVTGNLLLKMRVNAMEALLFPAACFGKLPVFADFVRCNAAGRETIAFDQWLQQGLFHGRNYFGAQWDAIFEKAPTYHFVFLPENAGRFLVGILRPSRDKSDRKYPFQISVLVDRPRFGDVNAHMVPIVFADFFDRACKLMEHALSGIGMQELYGQTEALAVSPADAFTQQSTKHSHYLEKTDLRSFLHACLGTAEEEKRDLVFANLTASMLPLRRHSAARFALGLRFPLSANDDLIGHQACFWAQVALRASGGSFFVPSMFWTCGEKGGPGYLFLFFRQPSPRVFVQLVQPDLQSDGICNIDTEGGTSVERTRAILNRDLRNLLDNGSQKLSEFLAHLAAIA